MTAPPKRQHRGSFVSLAGTLEYEWRNCTSPICPDWDLPHRDAPPEPAAPDRIGKLANWTKRAVSGHDDRVDALEKRLDDMAAPPEGWMAFRERHDALEKLVEEQQEQLAAITSSVLRLEDPAPAAEERGETITLHRWVNGSGRGQWTECVTPCKPWMDTQVSAWKHRTAHFDTPDAEARESCPVCEEHGAACPHLDGAPDAEGREQP